jgi:hypothetical protein
MKPTPKQVKGYSEIKVPAYKSSPAESTEGDSSKAKIPAFVKKFQNFQPDKR